ncbi:MAG: right-handed parallel beta-helix repeat-containing protein [Actinomycetota bacterium]|nr:right-handed parallel beta-helix repeat-containing protein [Actinomycetota bacterium]
MATRTSRRLARYLLLATVASGVVAVMPAAPAATASVSVRDNFFSPQEIHVDAGDTVTWTNTGTRTHDVTADGGSFVSGDLFRGATFGHTFAQEGTYYYHCSFHGRAGKQGMWGVVVVGDPEPETPVERPRIDVPGAFKTIQAAVDAAEPGSTIVVAPGTYRGGVTVTTDDLILRGVDRYRTVLNGEDERAVGILVDGAARVTVANLTVRNFLVDGISFVDSFRYTAKGIEAIKNRMHGVSATRSYEGVMRSSFGWAGGEAAFHVADCMGCGTLLDRLDARSSHTGYAAVDATGVTIRYSAAVGNGVGIAVLSTSGASPGRGALVVDNFVRGSRAPARPPLRSAGTFGIPRGTGIWLAGVANTAVRSNDVYDQDRYGILVSATGDGLVPEGNTVADNSVLQGDLGILAWDGAGADNCFDGNVFAGPTAPPGIETLYACERRPFAGEPYEPVAEDVAAALPASLALETADPREPDRPRCQKGRPGCRRRGASVSSARQ